jgi:hypothetical protein
MHEISSSLKCLKLRVSRVIHNHWFCRTSGSGKSSLTTEKLYVLALKDVLSISNVQDI